jgi:3D (Asp-Asp-Asp) domain-containing protein
MLESSIASPLPHRSLFPFPWQMIQIWERFPVPVGKHIMNWTIRLRTLALEARRHAGVLLVACGVVASGFLPAPGAGDGPVRITMPSGIAAWSLNPEPAGRPAATPRQLFRIPVTVTGYSSSEDQTDSTPFVTASNTQVRPGIIALSRDLLREYTPGAPFSFGDLVDLEGVGVFRVEDTMASRYRQRADIWFTNRTAAVRWGRQHLYAAKLSQRADRQDRRLRGWGSLPLFRAALAD